MKNFWPVMFVLFVMVTSTVILYESITSDSNAQRVEVLTQRYEQASTLCDQGNKRACLDADEALQELRKRR